MNWLPMLGVLLAGIFGGGGTIALIGAVARRKPTKVEAVDRLNESTLEWAEQLKADAREARLDAREARTESAEMRRELAEMRRQLQVLADEIRALHSAILDPNATIERLRQTIATNGRP